MFKSLTRILLFLPKKKQSLNLSGVFYWTSLFNKTFIAGILEDQIEGGKIGPLFQCLLIEQFRRLRDGDRFFYEHPSVFKPNQLDQIKQYTIARVLCDNGDNITKITRDTFRLPDLQGGFIVCEEIPRVDLKLWSECCSDCKYSGQLNTISLLNARRSRRHLEDEEQVLAAEGRRKWINNENVYANTTSSVAQYQIEIETLKTRIFDLENELDRMKTNVRKLNKVVRDLEKKKVQH